MSEFENKAFCKEHELKITNYIEHINSMSFLDDEQLKEGLETLNSINPKVMKFWDLINEGQFIASLMGSEWYNMANWINILQEFEPTITELIDYFTDLYPIFFQNRGL